uniref:Reverse transcriptase domain-containing protein n=1 Tax=Trichuris muris TaxID=70415 RepID=A0A5S6Q5T6_TRIMR
MEIENSESILRNSTRKLVERYEVGLLWKDPNYQLPNSRPQALGRLTALKRRLSVDMKLKEAYQSEIDSLVQNGIAKKEVASETDSRKGRAWYLPHHGVRSVAKPDKLRVVFDDSAVFNGISLNNMLSKGPPLLSDLCHLLIRFRRYQIAVAADVDHMFLQVAVSQSDQTVIRFLWRNSSHKPLRTYQMTRQVFGLTSAQLLASTL